VISAIATAVIFQATLEKQKETPPSGSLLVISAIATAVIFQATLEK